MSKNEIDLKINRIIEKLALQPHPEGGFYKETFRSNINITVDKERYWKSEKSAGTSIYYLLRKNEFSAWHRIKSDKVWNYHSGSSVTLHMINSETGLYNQAVIDDVAADETVEPQFMVKANTWFAASVNDKASFSLVGRTVFPGFDFTDFELADAALIDTYPKLTHIIIKYLSTSLELLN